MWGEITTITYALEAFVGIVKDVAHALCHTCETMVKMDEWVMYFAQKAKEYQVNVDNRSGAGDDELELTNQLINLKQKLTTADADRDDLSKKVQDLQAKNNDHRREYTEQSKKADKAIDMITKATETAILAVEARTRNQIEDVKKDHIEDPKVIQEQHVLKVSHLQAQIDSLRRLLDVANMGEKELDTTEPTKHSKTAKSKQEEKVTFHEFIERSPSIIPLTNVTHHKNGKTPDRRLSKTPSEDHRRPPSKPASYHFGAGGGDPDDDDDDEDPTDDDDDRDPPRDPHRIPRDDDRSRRDKSSTPFSAVSFKGSRRRGKTAKVDVPTFSSSNDDKLEFDMWYFQMTNRLRTNADHFADDEAAFGEVVSRLSGQASRNIYPFIRSDAGKSHIDTVEDLMNHLWLSYHDFNANEKARGEYENLVMRHSDRFRDFKVAFTRLAGHCGIPDSQ